MEKTYGVVDDILSPRVVVDVDGDATQGGHLGRQLVQARVVLALALVGLGHDGRCFFVSLVGGLISWAGKLLMGSTLGQSRVFVSTGCRLGMSWLMEVE